MRAARLNLIVAISIGVLASGTLPPEHLHQSTAAHPSVVHSHLEYSGSTAERHHPVLFNVDDDDHQTAIDIDRVMAAGPRAVSHGAPALVPAAALFSWRCVAPGGLPAWVPDATPSPPPRLAASRAPPA